MNRIVLSVLLLWTAISLLALLLAQLIAANHPPMLAHSLPLSCVPVGKTNNVCYTCVSRKNLHVLPFHSIQIESNYRFSFVKFK